MGLSAAENRVLNEIARRTAAEDPEYTRRLSAFGGYDSSVMGLPSRWALLPVVLVGLLMLAVFFAATIATAGHAGGTDDADRTAQVHLRP
ncbi:DUF3040 domain-containing protein [Spirillospora sp. NPDC047279]|uniref:DUF3040 domain-containing protein n=1 Tax=Spirillospora sp. NPDC047279 TaxID=3155478 RepID=UPI0033C6BB39